MAEGPGAGGPGSPGPPAGHVAPPPEMPADDRADARRATRRHERAAAQAAKAGGPWVGLDINSGKDAKMDLVGVYDPLFVARHALDCSTEAACSVLRSDDVLWAKQDAQTPDWQSEMEEQY